MDADGNQLLVHLFIVGKNRPAVAITAQHLRREKARRGDVAEAACALPVDRAAKALRGVLHHQKVVFPADLFNLGKLRRLAKEVHWDDRLWRELSLPEHALNLLAQGIGVHIERVRVNITEYRRRPSQADHFRRSEEGKARHNHRVALVDAPSHQRHQQGVCSAGNCHTVFPARIGAERFFQLFHLRPGNKMTAFNHRSNSRVNLFF